MTKFLLLFAFSTLFVGCDRSAENLSTRSPGGTSAVSGGSSSTAELPFDLAAIKLTGSEPEGVVNGVFMGDANRDHEVSIEDFSLCKSTFGSPVEKYTGCDFNGDGKVDLFDFGVLKKNFGKLEVWGVTAKCVATGKTLNCAGKNGTVVTLTNVSAFASSSDGKVQCAFANQALSCWGEPSPIKNIPTDLGSVKALAIGRDHACAVVGEGLRCWGKPGLAATSVPADLGPVSKISASTLQTCAVSGGKVRCWGTDSGMGELKVPADLSGVTAIASSWMYNCAIASDAVRCWGYSGYRNPFKQIDPADGAIAVSLGTEHACLVTKNKSPHHKNNVRCWGLSNKYGEVNVPEDMADVTAISANNYQTCVIVNQRTRCWGGTWDLPPNPAPEKFLAVSTEATETCAVGENHQPRCWGSSAANIPSHITALSNIAITQQLRCGVTASTPAKLDCWTPWAEGHRFEASTLGAANQTLSASDNRVCATGDGILQCFAVFGYFAPNWDTWEKFSPPIPLGAVTGVAVGHYLSCAISDGTLKCWKYERYLNEPWEYKVPADLGTVTAVAVADSYVCAIANKRARCWNSSNTLSFFPPADLGDVTTISSGTNHSCAIKTDGKLRCWGDNTRGQTNVPGDLTNVTSVTVGPYHTCAIAAQGLRCWGDNSNGQSHSP